MLSSRSLEAVGIEVTVGSSGPRWPGEDSIVCTKIPSLPVNSSLDWRCWSMEEESDSALKVQSTILDVIKVFMNDWFILESFTSCREARLDNGKMSGIIWGKWTPVKTRIKRVWRPETTTVDPLYTGAQMARLCCVCLELLNPGACARKFWKHVFLSMLKGSAASWAGMHDAVLLLSGSLWLFSLCSEALIRPGFWSLRAP